MSFGDATNVTTGEVRLSYVHLFKPYAHQQGQDEKFSCTILLPKTDTATKARIDAAIQAAAQKGAADKWNGVMPPIINHPVYDGDGVRPSDGMPFGPECKGHWVFTASTSADYPPEVVDERCNPIINQSAVYSGMYAMVNVEFFPYLHAGKKGVGCSLGPVKKTRDGEPLSGSAPTASQVFGGAAPQAASPAQAPAGAWAPQGGSPAPRVPTNPVNGQPIPVDPITGRPVAVNPITGLPY